MDAIIIPDDVYENRCRWCVHYQKQFPNLPIEKRLLFSHSGSKRPCRILGIAEFSKIQGECLSFCSVPMFGVCRYCEHYNSFCPNECMIDKPRDQRTVFSTQTYGQCQTNCYKVCEHYKASKFWKTHILKNACIGRAPINFEFDTWNGIDILRTNKEENEKYKLSAIDKTISNLKSQGIKYRRLDFQNTENLIIVSANIIIVTIYYSYGSERGIKIKENRDNFDRAIVFDDCISFVYNVSELVTLNLMPRAPGAAAC
jgi:hypothetical protein